MGIIVSHVSHSTLAGRRDAYPGEVVRVGRHPSNEVVFDAHKDIAVSGRHAELYVEGDAVCVRDVGSRNGTFVNGTRISGPVPLGPDDTVQLGEDGPCLRVGLEAPAGSPPGKKMVGQTTLVKAIRTATDKERALTTRRFALGSIVVLIAAAAGVMIYKQREDERRRQEAAIRDDLDKTRQDVDAAKKDLGETKKIVARLDQEFDDQVAQAMQGLKKDLDDVRQRMGSSQAQVTRLVAELAERDRVLRQLRENQNLDKRQRDALIAAQQKKMDALKKELQQRQDALSRAIEKGASGGVPREQWKQVNDRYGRSVFLIVAGKQVQRGVSVMNGTGFVVRSDGLLATNAHVTKPLAGFSVRFVVQNQTGRRYEILDHKTHPNWSPQGGQPDIGLIRINTGGSRLPAIPLAGDQRLRALGPGTQVGTIGYPGELMWSYLGIRSFAELRTKRSFPSAVAVFKNGLVGRLTTYSGARGSFPQLRHIYHSCITSGGCSGSPLFDSAGYAVGVHHAGIGQVPVVTVGRDGKQQITKVKSAVGINMAVRIDEIRRFISQVGW